MQPQGGNNDTLNMSDQFEYQQPQDDDIDNLEQ